MSPSQAVILALTICDRNHSPLWFPMRCSLSNISMGCAPVAALVPSVLPTPVTQSLSDSRETWLQPPAGAALEQKHFLTQKNLFLHHQDWWEALGKVFLLEYCPCRFLGTQGMKTVDKTQKKWMHHFRSKDKLLLHSSVIITNTSVAFYMVLEQLWWFWASHYNKDIEVLERVQSNKAGEGYRN